MTETLSGSAQEQAAAVRALYAAGRPITAICRETGLCQRRIYYWLDHDIGPDGTVRVRPVLRRRGRRAPIDLARQRRLSLAERIWRAAEAQVCEIEARMVALDTGPGEAERDARALAVLARVLRELAVLETDGKAGKTAETRDAPPAAPADEDARARDIDTFRRELARRLDALRGDGAD